MTQRIICGDGCCSCSDPQLIEFNVTDNFKLVYKFTDNRYDPPMLIPLDSFDLTIRYYIEGREEEYIVSKAGMVAKNCIIYPERSIIKSIFSGTGLKSGKLYADYTFKYYDPELPDRMGNSSIIGKFTNIILKDS
jgi:hypothetical protein